MVSVRVLVIVYVMIAMSEMVHRTHVGVCVRIITDIIQAIACM